MRLGEAYKKELTKVLGEAATMFDYAELTDFDHLWSDGTNGLPAAAFVANAKKLIVAWDGMPVESDKLLHAHLTPMDWALAYSIRLLSTNKAQGADFSIHILDFTAHEFENAYSSRVLGTLLDEMPWVSIYAPIKPNAKRYRHRHDELKNIIDAVSKATPTFANSVSGNESGIKTALADIAKLWRASVVQSDDHHDLNNIVGPRIISRMVSPVPRSTEGCDSQDLDKHKPEWVSPDDRAMVGSVLCAFLKRLEWSELLPCFGGKGYEAPVFEAPLDIIAIDDQLARGWDRVLAALVGIPAKNIPASDYKELEVVSLGSRDELRLHGATDPGSLLKGLGIAFDWSQEQSRVNVDRGQYTSRTFDSPVSTNGASRPWMLILDIRFFSGQVAKERLWYSNLAKAVIQISASANGKLAWPGFEQEVAQIQYLAEGGDADDLHLDCALSLFPRLCSLRWPSIPIIVFSSTGRRGLISKLADYGNIFLASPKPNVLSGSPAEQAGAFAESWRRELGAALALINVQAQVLRLHQMRHELKNGASSKTAVGPASNTHKYIVIALDETGDFATYSNSAIGGVLLIAEGSTKDDAIQLAVKFQEELRAKGIVFYEHPPYYLETDSPGSSSTVPVLPKKSKISEMTHLVTEEKSFSGCRLAAFKYSIPKEMYRSGKGYKDAAYLEGLSRCIELLLCELFSSADVQFKRSNYSIWLASKQTFHSIWVDANKAFAPDPAQARQAAAKYDFRLESPGSSLVEAVGGFGTAYRVLIDAIGHRKCFDAAVDAAVMLRARKIPYQNDPEKVRSFSPPNQWYCPSCKDVKLGTVASPGAPTPRCSKCNSFQIADYSVMGHLADASLSPNISAFPHSDLAHAGLSMEYSYDVVASPYLDDFFYASKLFDQNRPKDAFKVAYRNNLFLNGLQRAGSNASANLCKSLHTAMHRHSQSIVGNDLIELSGLPLRGIQSVSGNSSHHSSKAKLPSAAPKHLSGKPVPLHSTERNEKLGNQASIQSKAKNRIAPKPSSGSKSASSGGQKEVRALVLMGFQAENDVEARDAVQSFLGPKQLQPNLGSGRAIGTNEIYVRVEGAKEILESISQLDDCPWRECKTIRN